VIIVCHYTNAGQPAHQLSDKRVSRLMAAIVDAQLVTDLGHAGYLRQELAQAELALSAGHR
jgi:hypothetical protein